MKLKINWPIAAYMLVLLVYYFIWSITKDYNTAPDEYVRYDIPMYIFKNGMLPDGYVDSIRNPLWGFSYAYYLTFLGPLISVFNMKIVSLFTMDEFALLVAARFTSVFFGTMAIYFVYKIGDMLFSNHGKWLMVVLLSMIPQYAYLCSYLNNDIIGVCGTAMVICAWVSGLKKHWNVRNCILLAMGIVVCALSYYNTYGWILLSILLFVFSYVIKREGYKDMWKYGILISAVVLVFISYFFIRNAQLYDGDVFGIHALTDASEKYAQDFLKPSNRETPNNLGESLSYMLFEKNWLYITSKSFVGKFGYMLYAMPRWIYWCFSLIFGIGLVAGAIYLSIYLSIYPKAICRSKRKLSDMVWPMFRMCLFIGMAIVIGLSLYYSYYTDYQPQGRYLYPAVVAFVYFVVYGYDKLLKEEKTARITKPFVWIACLALISANVYSYFYVLLPF